MQHAPWLAVRVSVADSLPGVQVVSSQDKRANRVLEGERDETQEHLPRL